MKLYTTALVWAVLNMGCMDGPGFFSQKSSPENDELALAYDDYSATVVDENGESYAVDAEVPEGVFTTGSLIITSGVSISNDINLKSTLELAESEDMSATVNVSSDETLEDVVVGSIFITVPFSKENLGLRQSTLAVAYHVTDKSGASWAGLILSDDYKETEDGLRFGLRGFGNYQIVKIPGIAKKRERTKIDTQPTKLEDEQASSPIASTPPSVFNGVPDEHLLLWMDPSVSFDYTNTPWTDSYGGVNAFNRDGQPAVQIDDRINFGLTSDGTASAAMSTTIPELAGNKSFHYFLVTAITGPQLGDSDNMLVDLASDQGNGVKLHYYGGKDYEKLKINEVYPSGNNTDLTEVPLDQITIIEVAYDHVEGKLTLWKDGVVEGHKTISLDLSGDISLADVSNWDIELNVYDFLLFDTRLSPQMRQQTFDVLANTAYTPPASL